MNRPVLVLDCDGVLLDSNGMKTATFERVLGNYPSGTVRRFLEYQKRSFGLTRKRLLENFFSEFLVRQPEPGELECLLKAFGTMSLSGYAGVAETEGATRALQELAQVFCLVVASGSLESELVCEFRRRGWLHLFEAVHGAPRHKEEILATLADRYGRESMLFVGDSPVDAQCARAADVRFIFMRRYSASPCELDRLIAAHAIPSIRILGELLTVETAKS